MNEFRIITATNSELRELLKHYEEALELFPNVDDLDETNIEERIDLFSKKTECFMRKLKCEDAWYYPLLEDSFREYIYLCEKARDVLLYRAQKKLRFKIV